MSKLEGLTLADTIHTEEYTIGAISMLNEKGDVRVMWDTRDEVSVAEARRVFAEMVAAGTMGRPRLAVKTTASGRADEQITEFDPQAERIVVMNPIAGG
jgi:hypothetical protein